MLTTIEQVLKTIGLDLRHRNGNLVCPLCNRDGGFAVFEGNDKRPPGFNCFKCNSSGNGYDLVAQLKSISNKEAFVLVNRTSSPTSKNRDYIKGTKRLERVWELYQQAAVDNNIVKQYLIKRGIESSAYRLGVGYAPPEGLLKTYYKDEELEALGLLSNSKQELFKNRIMFAYKDETGRIMQLQGRALEDSQQVRWLSSKCPTTKPISECLYNLDSIAKTKDKDGIVYICEGVGDCLTLESVGLTAIGTSGIRLDLTKHHEVLKNKTIIAAFDYDRELEGESEVPEYKSWSIVLSTLIDLYQLRQQDSPSTNQMYVLAIDEARGSDLNEWLVDCLNESPSTGHSTFVTEVKEGFRKIEELGYEVLGHSPKRWGELIRLLSVKGDVENIKKVRELAVKAGGFVNLIFHLVR